MNVLLFVMPGAVKWDGPVGRKAQTQLLRR